MPTTDDHRLPRTVTPSHYALELEPDIGSASFTGSATIAAQVHDATTEIVLNAAELEISGATVTDGSGARLELTWKLDEDAERLTLVSGTPIPPGPITLVIDFDGELNDKLRGFHRSQWTDEAGVTQTIATTQFESTNARRAFPCWDEPDLKATFDVTLVVPRDLLAISCGPEVSREHMENGRDRVAFGTTMRMSTYLLAFVVGPLEVTAPMDVDGTPLRVVHPPGKGHLTPFALEAGAFSLRHFAEYFGIPYPGAKLDLVALPNFAFGAMENLGCVTFREALLLLDPDETTQPEQQRVADVIAHEIAHMWFGDLVTMKWWDGIWLKEAFATFCEVHATNAFRPEWRRWDDFSSSRTAAFDIDSLTTTRPIEFEVVSPDDAEAMYDVLTYEKGAAVVRMLEQYLGEEAFRDGIRHYLDVHSYGNTETHDLWDAIEARTGQPARQIMDTWISQGGYPMVFVDEIRPGTVRLSQRQFTFHGTSDAAQWAIPMVIASESGGFGRTRRTVLLGPEPADVEVSSGSVAWLAANADASGFYRVRLHGDLGAGTIAAADRLTAVERYSLVDDAWAAFAADLTGIDEVLDVVHRLAVDESDTAVWKRMLSILRSIDRHVRGDVKMRFRRDVVALANDASARIGTEPLPDESARTSELRGALFETAGVLGDPEHMTTARTLLASPADPARTAAAVHIVAANGTGADFREFVERYHHAETPQDERRYLFALPMFEGDAEVDALLALVDADEIRSQDAGFVLGSALSREHSARQAWSFIAEHWEQLVDSYPSNAIPRMIAGAQGVADPELADEIDAFFETHEVPQAGATLFQHLERMRVTVAVADRLRRQMSSDE